MAAPNGSQGPPDMSQRGNLPNLLNVLSTALNSGAGPNAANAAQIGALLQPHIHNLVKAAQQGHLHPHQVEQLKQLAKAYGPFMQTRQPQNGQQQQQQQHMQQMAAAQASASASGSGLNQPTNRPLQNQTLQSLTQNITQGRSPVQGPSNPNPPISISPAYLQKNPNSATSQPTNFNGNGNIAAGVKRKSPPAPTGTPNPNGNLPLRSGSPASSQWAMAISQHLETSDPGAQGWPNHWGVRPTLNAGIGGFGVLLSTPVHLARPPTDLDVIDSALQNPTGPMSTSISSAAGKKDGQGAGGTVTGARKTVKEIIQGVDPSVVLDVGVEDFLLQMADEFIDSVAHFACRVAKHRGSDTLDVEDFQLHLENNHNIRIPAFASDHTRLAIAQSVPIEGQPVAKKIKLKLKGKDKEGDKDAEKGGEKEKVGLGRGMRSARLAAARAAR